MKHEVNGAAILPPLVFPAYILESLYFQMKIKVLFYCYSALLVNLKQVLSSIRVHADHDFCLFEFSKKNLINEEWWQHQLFTFYFALSPPVSTCPQCYKTFFYIIYDFCTKLVLVSSKHLQSSLKSLLLG